MFTDLGEIIVFRTTLGANFLAEVSICIKELYRNQGSLGDLIRLSEGIHKVIF